MVFCLKEGFLSTKKSTKRKNPNINLPKKSPMKSIGQKI